MFLTDSMIFKLMQNLTSSMLLWELILSMKTQRPCNWVTQRDALLFHSSFDFVGSYCFAAIKGQGGIAPVPVRPPTFYPDFDPSHHMQGRGTGRVAPQAVGFKCCHCNGEFGSRQSMEFRRRHITSIGTPCADPRSYMSLSFSGRADMSTGILRQRYVLHLMYNSRTMP